MLWKKFNLRRFSVHLAGLLAFCLGLYSSSVNAETYSQYLERLEGMWDDNTPVWLWHNPPSPQTFWNASYDIVCAWSDSSGSYISGSTPLRSKLGSYNIYGTCASNFPFPGSVFPGLANPNYSPFPYRTWCPVWLLDATFPVGASVPFGGRSYSGGHWEGDPDPNSSFSYYVYSSTNVHSSTALAGRGYILPQRVFETNGWGDRLWDMYGDGRMFLPRLVVECGFLAQQNVLDFDPSLWEQLHFRGEYTPSKVLNVQPFSDLEYIFDGMLTDALWFDGQTRPLNAANSSVPVVFTNQGLFGTNLLVASQFPYMYELFGLPPVTNLGQLGWARYRYIPDSVTFGDFGVGFRGSSPTNSPQQLSELGKRGVRGLCFSGVSRLNGATLRFARFVAQPLVRTSDLDPFARLTFWVPSGLAWDNDGGCCFNWSKDGKPFSSLFKWPLTAAWDFLYVVDVRTNGTLVAAGSGTVTNINSRVPTFGPMRPDSAPPVPAPGRGGENGAGFNGPGFFPFGSDNGQLSFTSGILLEGSGGGSGGGFEGGSGGRETPTSSSSLTYGNTASTLPVDDNGDLTGDYNLTLPSYSAFYTWNDLEDKNSLEYSLFMRLSDEAGWANDDAVWDWGSMGIPDGDFGAVLQQSTLGMDYSEGASPESEGFFNYFRTDGEWFYETLNYEAIFPRYDTLVMPWPSYDSQTGEWDFSQQREFAIPTEFTEYRDLLLWAVGIGVSLLFIAGVMSLFSGK